MLRSGLFTPEVVVISEHDRSVILFDAVYKGEASKVHTLLLNGISTNIYRHTELQPPSYLSQPLLIYFFRGLKPIIDMLLSPGDHTNIMLEHALLRVSDFQKIAKLLIDYNIDPDLPPMRGNTVSDVAIYLSECSPRKQALDFKRQIEEAKHEHVLKAPLLLIMTSITSLPKKKSEVVHLPCYN